MSDETNEPQGEEAQAAEERGYEPPAVDDLDTREGVSVTGAGVAPTAPG